MIVQGCVQWNPVYNPAKPGLDLGIVRSVGQR